MSEFLVCFPKEIWETYIIPRLDIKDILEIRYTNSIFNEINWEYMIKTEYPKLYENLFNEISNKHSIIKVIMDYEKVFLTIHGNIKILDMIYKFIK